MMSSIIGKKNQVDLSEYNFSFSLTNKLVRVIWRSCFLLFFRPFVFNWCRPWRIFLLRRFGAKIGFKSNVAASVKIWAPWNLELGDFSSIGPKVDCYNQGKIKIGDNTVISQKTYLCASSHDFTLRDFPLILKPITIENQVWIAADAFIAPGVKVEEGAVVGARAAAFRNVEKWTVVGGNPAVYIKDRKMKL